MNECVDIRFQFNEYDGIDFQIMNCDKLTVKQRSLFLKMFNIKIPLEINEYVKPIDKQKKSSKPIKKRGGLLNK